MTTAERLREWIRISIVGPSEEPLFNQAADELDSLTKERDLAAHHNLALMQKVDELGKERDSLLIRLANHKKS